MMKIFDKFLRILNFRKKNIGYLAESVAAKYLKKECHLKILARNYRSGHYETDIIAYDKAHDCIAFVEVKCRPTYAKVRGYYAATSKRKMECLKKSARAFIRENKAYDRNIRFDVVEVEHDENQNITTINYIQG